jgi:hypothetical protein
VQGYPDVETIKGIIQFGVFLKECNEALLEEEERWNKETETMLKRGKELDEDALTTGSDVELMGSSEEASACSPDLISLKSSKEALLLETIAKISKFNNDFFANDEGLLRSGVDGANGAT